MLNYMQFIELIKQYDNNPQNLYPQDLFPFIEFLIEQRVHISANDFKEIRLTEEPDMPETIKGVHVLQPKNASTDMTALITIGVHGNEIWAGALCALEAFSQHKKGSLTGTVIIQIANIKAVQGYVRAYDPEQYFLDRNGWRETNGIEREVLTVRCDDGSRVDVLSDFNRIPRQVMTLPRGQNFNVDRAQELLWLYRAFLRGFRIKEDASLYKAHAPYNIRFVMLPHTSRMVGGIRNIALPPRTTQQFLLGQYDDMLCNLPEDLTTMLEWTGSGLGGKQNLIFDEHIEIQHFNENKSTETLPLIITFELGNHEDFCPDTMSCLNDLCGPATRVLLENAKCLNGMSSGKRCVQIKTIRTEPYRLDLSYYDGFDALDEGDSIYLIREREAIETSDDYVAGHFSKSIIVKDDGTCNVIDTHDINEQTTGRIFYCMPPFELSYLKAGQPIMIAFGADKRAKFLAPPYDMYAVFTGDCRLEFPVLRWHSGINKQKTFFRGLAENNV